MLPCVALDVPVELRLGPVDLAAGLAGVLGAQVDLVVDGHVPHLAVQAHDGAAQVAHEPLVLPHLGGHLGDLHVRLALRNELYSTEMQENTLARLRESIMHQGASHAT